MFIKKSLDEQLKFEAIFQLLKLDAKDSQSPECKKPRSLSEAELSPLAAFGSDKVNFQGKHLWGWVTLQPSCFTLGEHCKFWDTLPGTGW